MRNWPVAILSAFVLLCLGACAGMQQSAQANRPDGEGYAGVGELLVQIRVMEENKGFIESFKPRKNQRATVEIRYRGIDEAGHVVFERHDADLLAGLPVPPAPGAEGSGGEAAYAASALPPNTRQIVLDLRLARQIRVQGKIIEIVEAGPSGVVFRLY
ncbi:MAG TPA: hypothetical protein VED47_13840 [Burkholderiaceae bacterium]|nr:hypothetical protein [Burkholderiaceae bacterium]